jgi:pyruvate dehydrogenase E1 component alpha subunit
MPLHEIGSYSISYLQVLDEHGNLDQELEPELSEEQLIRVYRSMVLAREVDQRMLNLQRQGRLGTFAPCTGQEAAVCGPTLAMTPKDWFVCSFRETPGRLMRGETILQTFLFYNGYEEGNLLAPSSRTLPVAIPVSSQIPHAVGIAYAMKYRGEKDSAVVAFFGDGGTSQGDFHEALNFASLWRAPVVFVCQNNQWAISVPRNKQSHTKTLAQKAIAYDMPGIQVDGNDALAMYKATREALDDPKKYRSEEEVQDWWQRDPIPRFKLYLERKGFWNEQLQAEMDDEIKKEIENAVKELESKTDFKPDAPFDHVFGTPHQEIEEQRADFLADLAEFEKKGAASG